MGFQVTSTVGAPAASAAPRALTYRSAMLRGAWAGAMWALATCAVSSAAVTAFDLRGGSGFLGYMMDGVGVFGNRLDMATFFVPGGAIAGGLASVFGRYAELPPPRIRGAFIWLSLFPASGLAVAIYLWVFGLLDAFGVFPALGGRQMPLLDTVVSLPKVVFGIFLFGLPGFTPWIALPLAPLAWSVEGATRPADQPTTGLAKKRNRVILAAVVLTASALAYGYAFSARSTAAGAHASVGVYDISNGVTTLLASRAGPAR